MTGVVVPSAGRTPGEVRADLARRGLGLHSWGNGPGETYGWHDHPYRKTLVCLEGTIVFHTDDGDLPLAPGDVLELPAGTRHAATVGPAGVCCAEAST
jgi:mannose-6-phosphate isomerase-like protein (cupin superfamily)